MLKFWLAAVVGLAALLSMPVRTPAAENSVDAKRVEAIAAVLTDQPMSFGRPITDRQAWEALAKQDAFRNVVPQADKLLTEKLPDLPDDLFLDFSRTGNRTRWQNVNGRRDGRLDTLVLAECLENKGRFLPAIEEAVRSFCQERTWVMPAHDGKLLNFEGKTIDIDLHSSARAWSLATIAYLLGDKLDPQVRALIHDNVRRRVLDPFRDMVEGKRPMNWWMKGTNNWNAVCLAGVTGAALATPADKADRAFYVAAAEKYSENFLHGFTSDGYCSEGLGYWDYGFGNYVLLAEIVYQATHGAVDLMMRPEVRRPATFGARIEIINGVSPAFADCSINARPSSRIMYYVSRRFGLGLRDWEDRDPASPGGGLPEAMMYSFPNSASQTPPAGAAAAGPGLRDWFDKAGILICRPGNATGTKLGAALKGGNNAENHNHNDVGSYVAVVGDEPLILDPGGEVYTARTFSSHRYDSKLLNSFGHDVPLVAGQLQRTGPEAQGKVVKTDFTAAADTVTFDISFAYSVPDLEKLQRTFVYSREGAGSLTVTDEVAFKQPQSFGTALITYGTWKQTGTGSLTIFGMAEAAHVEIQASAAYEIKPEEIKEDAAAGRHPTRLGINLKDPVTSATITVKITPLAVDEGTSGGNLVRNGGFEMETWGWNIPNDGFAARSTEQAAGGSTSLKITDTDKTRGSNIVSARMAVDGKGTFELRGNYFGVSGSGVGIYVRYLDSHGTVLNQEANGQMPSLGSLGGSDKKWQPFAYRFTTPPDTKSLQIWIHSYNGAVVEGYLDDIEIVPVRP